MQTANRLVIFEQGRIRNREDRTAQRREYHQLLIGTLDGAQEIADRLDLLALIERAALNEHVRNVTSLECANIWTRNVAAESIEAPKQNTYVARLDRHALIGRLAFGHRPSALRDQPMHIGGGRLGTRGF